MQRFGRNRSVLSRMSSLIQAGVVKKVPAWYESALRNPPDMSCRVSPVKPIVYDWDELNEKHFNKQFERRYGVDPVANLEPLTRRSSVKQSFREVFVRQWHELREKDKSLSLEASFDQVAESLSELLEETKCRLAAARRLQMDPEGKHRKMNIEEIEEQKRLDKIDVYLRKRRVMVENIVSAAGIAVEGDGGDNEELRKMDDVRRSIEQRRQQDKWD